MALHSVVITFPSNKWEEYGKHVLPSFDKFWPENVNAYVYLEGDQKLPMEFSDRVKIINMDTVMRPVNEFVERNKHRGIEDLGTTGNIAVQAAKFARKVYAQIDVLKKRPSRYVWYLDADLATLNPINHEFLNNLVSTDAYIGCLPRKPKYTETGFISWDTEHPMHDQWVELYEECYRDDKIFNYSAWHDCIAFDHATDKLLADGKIMISDYGYGVKSSHPLVAGPLGAYFDHMKGPRKYKGFSKERVARHG